MSVGIQDALAKLYLKLGGDPEDIKENKNVTDYLDDLADVFLSLAELPAVSSSDNEKFLQVVNGKWEKSDKDIYGNLIKTLETDSDGDYISLTKDDISKINMSVIGDSNQRNVFTISVHRNISGTQFTEDVYRLSYRRSYGNIVSGKKIKVFTSLTIQDETNWNILIKRFTIKGTSAQKCYIETTAINAQN